MKTKLSITELRQVIESTEKFLKIVSPLTKTYERAWRMQARAKAQLGRLERLMGVAS